IYAIDTPPPTISGKMHIGHAFSYTQMDIIARYHRMKGENVFYPFGTDDNGLPTEKLVEKENNVNIFDMDRNDFVDLCQETIKEIRPKFIEGWKKIGMSCDFNLDYSTISKDVRKISQKYFIDLFNKERIYRKESPALWCPNCQTAIAQAEMEDKEIKSTFNDIKFSLKNGGEIIIATTRPELLPSCVAIFVHPKDERYKNLIGEKVIVLLFEQEVEIIADENVDTEKGTGIVMCCTFGDTTDIEWYKTHNLPLKISINKKGEMTKKAGKYEGCSIKEARKEIIKDLDKAGMLLGQQEIIHTVNVHERCDSEIEILPTTQWFIKYLDLKKQFLEDGEKMNWNPKFMRTRYENWVKGLKWDWCISRQRYFGIPLPLWYCKECGEIKLPQIENLPVDPITDKPDSPCSCGSDKFIPEKDVLDTWATSSLTPQIAANLVEDSKTKERLFPMSLRPQAHDIINFWLFYTEVRSRIHFDKIPWKDIVISGFVLDKNGEKMSKSKGNVIAPQDIIDKYGVDALRYWTASVSAGEDIRCSEKEIEKGKKTVIKLLNASKFSFIHLDDFTPEGLNKKELEEEDKWILSCLQTTINKYRKNLDQYNYSKARKIVDNFFWNKFTDNYIEMIKERLYNDQNSKPAQETLYHTLFAIIQMYAPYIPFITEEIYQKYFKKNLKKKSIHLTLLPEKDKTYIDRKLEKDFDLVINIISAVRKYKSKNKYPMNKEIEKLIIESETNLEKYFKVIQNTMSIKEIKKGKGNLSVGEENREEKKAQNNIKIKIKN
ncbi:MAG: valine--tRNA ligase, partial [Minisyncoccales bacterium]